jgi:hypothetical protein
MDITQYLKYNNIKVELLELSKIVSGWSLSKNTYKTEKIISITPIKVNTYYTINGIKFHINSELLTKINNNIESIFVEDLYNKFINNQETIILNYKFENIIIDKFEFVQKASVRNYCTFLDLNLSENMLYVPYSEYSILIKGALFI